MSTQTHHTERVIRMPSKIIHLKTPTSPTQAEDAEPHLSGKGHCLNCHHVWVAVAPLDTVDLECPECHTMKGVFNYAVTPPDDVDVWTCSCDNQLFYITPEGHWCPNCGQYNSY